MDEEKSALAVEAKDCREGSKGFVGGDNGGGLPFTIFQGSGGAAEDNKAVVYEENAMSPVDGRMVPRGERETDISICRERCQPQ